MANILYSEDNLDVYVKYEFVAKSTPLEWINQYYSVRQQVYTNYWNLKNFSGGESHYDKLGFLLLALYQNNCIGGIRLVSSDINENLPLETDTFKIIDLFPQLNLEAGYYGEIGRAVLLPEFHGGNHSKELYRKIALKSKELNHQYAFAVATVVHARKTRIACKSFGLRVDICEDIEIPDLPTYEGLEMRLMIIHIGDWNI